LKAEKVICPFTGEAKARKVFVYSEPPPGEIRFKPIKDEKYYREIWQFALSRHYMSVHCMNLSDLYDGAYVDANYQDIEGLRESFERIIGLPPERSDNAGRIEHINTFLQERFQRPFLL